MNKTKIEWTDWTWNPIKGICPVGCWYCYARNIYKRFKLNEKYYQTNGELLLVIDPMELKKLQKIKSAKIFVCSTVELFHPKIPKEWRDWLFSIIEREKQHTFQILTKFPQNIDRPMPDNVWLGVTVTDKKDMWRISELWKKKFNLNHIVFVSFEPLLDEIWIQGYYLEWSYLDWIIIGRLTQYGNKFNPQKKWVENLVIAAKNYKIPIFLKDNLKEIWGGPLIQEFPE